MEVISFIEALGAADTNQIDRLFFNRLRIAQRRLKRITEESDIKRCRDPVTNRYIYYTSKAQLQHKLIRTELYLRMKQGPGNILNFATEYTIDNVRADAFVIYECLKKVYLMFVEVQTSNNPVDLAKYESLFFARKFPVFPRLVVVTDKKVENNSRLTVKIIPTNLSNWEDCLK